LFYVWFCSSILCTSKEKLKELLVCVNKKCDHDENKDYFFVIKQDIGNLILSISSIFS
jgi:hypothetical protein